MNIQDNQDKQDKFDININKIVDNIWNSQVYRFLLG